MPFNGSGTFSIINTFIPNTTILSSAVNQNYTDIATGLSDCLTRDNQAGMTDIFRAVAGTTSAPGISFTSDTTSGVALPASHEVALVTNADGVQVNGDVFKVSSAAIAAGGSGYVVGDTIVLSGGTALSTAVLTVATLSGSAVATVTVLTAGRYVTKPSDPVAQASTSGVGSGATFNITWADAFAVTNVAKTSLSTNLGASEYIASIMQTRNAAALTQLIASTIGASSLAGSALGINGMINGIIISSQSGNAQTFTLKTLAGNTPSSSDPVLFILSNVPSGQYYVVRTISSALSFTISSGSTLGTTNNVPFKIWVVAVDTGSSIQLGVINCVSGTNIYPLGRFPYINTTAEGGAGGADSAQVIYTASAQSLKAFVPIGYAIWEVGQATAGLWSSGESYGVRYGPGVPLPGDVIQIFGNETGAVSTGTTVIPDDDTIPQVSEGNSYLSQAITPTSGSNILEVDAAANLSSSLAANNIMIAAMFRDSTANALSATSIVTGSATLPLGPLRLLHRELATTASATTFTVRGGAQTAGTTTFNGRAGSRLYGGVFNSYIRVSEIMT